jgi:hypothetical protein
MVTLSGEGHPTANLFLLLNLQFLAGNSVYLYYLGGLAAKIIILVAILK